MRTDAERDKREFAKISQVEEEFLGFWLYLNAGLLHYLHFAWKLMKASVEATLRQ